MALTVPSTSETQERGDNETSTATVPATRVVVLGGSIAGMLAAAAVSHFVDEVVMIDKDAALSGSGSEENLREVGLPYTSSSECFEELAAKAHEPAMIFEISMRNMRFLKFSRLHTFVTAHTSPGSC